MPDDRQPPPQDDARQPRDIASTFDLRIGRHVTLQGRASISPAGILCAGLAVAAMTLALGSLVGALRRRRD